MSDVVARLHKAYKIPDEGVVVVSPKLLVSAADCIDALEAEVERLRKDLAADHDPYPWLHVPSGTRYDEPDDGVMYAAYGFGNENEGHFVEWASAGMERSPRW